MPRKAKPFTPVKPRATDSSMSLLNPKSVRAREYSQTQFGWDAQRRWIMNKYRMRKTRALKQLKNTSAFNLMTTEERDTETATVLASIADAMTKELNETYAEWKAKTGGLDLNDSSEEDSESNEEYEEWHGIDADPEMPDKADSGPHKQGNEVSIASDISRIWKRFEKKFHKTVELYSKIDAMKEEGDDEERDDGDEVE